MTPEQQKVAIAGACGWRRFTSFADGVFVRPPEDKLPEWADRECPDYLNDLNDMHEAWKTVIAPERQHFLQFENVLRVIVERDAVDPAKAYFPALLTNATAPQRCEAFLRTLNLWTE